jgi:hypothetical protein
MDVSITSSNTNPMRATRVVYQIQKSQFYYIQHDVTDKEELRLWDLNLKIWKRRFARLTTDLLTCTILWFTTLFLFVQSKYEDRTRIDWQEFTKRVTMITFAILFQLKMMWKVSVKPTMHDGCREIGLLLCSRQYWYFPGTVHVAVRRQNPGYTGREFGWSDNFDHQSFQDYGKTTCSNSFKMPGERLLNRYRLNSSISTPRASTTSSDRHDSQEMLTGIIHSGIRSKVTILE